MSTDGAIKCEVQRWRTRTLESGQLKKTIDHTGEPPINTHGYALVAEKVFNKQGQLDSSTLHVNSPHILKAFRDAVGEHFSVPSKFCEPVTLSSPFQMLIHHWLDLKAHKDQIKDDEARMHVSLLVDQWMEDELGPTRKALDAELQSGMCFYKTCWAIFKPGDRVINFDKGFPWLLTVQKTAYEENNRIGMYLDVYCTYTSHNGDHAGVANHTFRIIQKEYFAQESPAIITGLPVYPLVRDGTTNALEDDLYRRGTEFLDICKEMKVFRYNGVALYAKVPPPLFFDPEEGEDWITWKSYTESGRVIVDQKTYGEEHTPKSVSKVPHLERSHIIQCPPSVFGYSCTMKEWCRFFIPNLTDPAWRTDPFKHLVLAPEVKDLVQALVSSHQYPEAARDQSLQKGKGLVCLLHGPPGSGKTLTAECSAELTQRALFQCSLSEINKYNENYSFEYRLVKILHLATTWRAIVLLDEADVFLESRQDEGAADIARNSLVAVFLRHLEYFSGTIFLTTNRIQVFDAAMKSRIHLALGYNEPDRASRRTMWQYQLMKAVHDLEEGPELEEMLDLVDGISLNGREIANFVQTAHTLARYHNEPLSSKHVQVILRTRREFTAALQRKKDNLIARSPSVQRVGSWPLRRNSILEEEPEQM